MFLKIIVKLFGLIFTYFMYILMSEHLLNYTLRVHGAP